jgi:hypothetical protein
MATETCEVHLNRRGINSVEVPPKVELEAGSTLLLKVLNHGSPLHITLSSSNSRMFTDFYHENLYLRDSIEYPIAILEDAYAGFFDIEVITGYGTNKGSFRVFVKKFIEKEVPAAVPDQSPETGTRASAPWIPAGILTIGAAFYIAWYTTGDVLWNYLAFAALVIGVLSAWYSRQ